MSTSNPTPSSTAAQPAPASVIPQWRVITLKRVTNGTILSSRDAGSELHLDSANTLQGRLAEILTTGKIPWKPAPAIPAGAKPAPAPGATGSKPPVPS